MAVICFTCIAVDIFVDIEGVRIYELTDADHGNNGLFYEEGNKSIERYKNEISKAGFMRIHFPIIGDVDFTPDDIDALYKCITAVSAPPALINSSPQLIQQ